MEYRKDEDIERDVKPIKKFQYNVQKIIGRFLILVAYTNIILIGFKIALFIISLYHCLSEVKIFYILNMIAIIFSILYLLLFLKYFTSLKSDTDDSVDIMFLKIRILVFTVYVFDSVIYFFYYYEEIEKLTPLVLLIINDVLFIPSFYLSFMECCETLFCN